MAEKNGNGVLKTTLWTILWCLLVGGYGFTLLLATETKNTFIENDCKYISRDEAIKDSLDKKYEVLQKDMNAELSTIKENQATLLARQNFVIETLKEIKQDIKKIQ